MFSRSEEALGGFFCDFNGNAPRRLQEKLRADKKAEILDRMRRKQQEEEEKREKDEIEAQKQREARARRPVRCLHSMRLVSIRRGDFGPFRTVSRLRRPAQIEAEKQAASGLAKMGLVDPSLRKKEHGPKAAAKKARRLYNSVVHGVADQKAEQQETSNMTQYCVSVF